MFQQEVEELFFLQTGAFIVTYVTSCGRWSGAFKSWSQPVIYSDLPFPHSMPSCAFQHCTSTWALFVKYFNHSMLPHLQSVAKTGRALPALQRERQAEKLSLSQPNRQSMLEMFQQEVEELFFLQSDWCLHCYVMVGGDRWCAFKSWSQPVIYSDFPLAHILCPAVPFNTAQALECFLPPNISSSLCFPICRVLLRLVTGMALPALQRECQLRSSAFPNQTDNLSLRCFSRKSKNYAFSSPTGAFIVTSWWEVIAGVPSILTIEMSLLPADSQLCLSTLHQHLSAFCQIFQSQYASPSAERC